MTLYILVNHNGINSKMSRKFGNQELLITTDAWIADNILHHKHLIVEKRYPHEDIDKAKASIHDLDILKCDISDMEIQEIYTGYNIYKAKLLTYSVVHDHEKLRSIRNNLLESRELNSDFFDRTNYKLLDGTIDTKCTVNSSRIDVSFNYQIDKSTKNIEESISRQVSYSSKLLADIDIKKIKTYIATELLDTARNWLDDEQNIDINSFAERIVLEEFSIYDDLEYTFSFNDNDIFAGHYVHARGKMDEGLVEAYMQ